MFGRLSNIVPDHVNILQFHHEREGREDGMPLNVLLHTPTPNRGTIRFLYFFVNDELFQYNWSEKKLENSQKDNSYLTLPCRPMLIKDSSEQISKRLILQIKANESVQLKQLLEKFDKKSNLFQESGFVLVHAIKFELEKKVTFFLKTKLKNNFLFLKKKKKKGY